MDPMTLAKSQSISSLALAASLSAAKCEKDRKHMLVSDWECSKPTDASKCNTAVAQEWI